MISQNYLEVNKIDEAEEQHTGRNLNSHRVG